MFIISFFVVSAQTSRNEISNENVKIHVHVFKYFNNIIYSYGQMTFILWLEENFSYNVYDKIRIKYNIRYNTIIIIVNYLSDDNVGILLFYGKYL